MTTPKERIIELLKDQEIDVSTFFPSIGLSYSNFKGKQLKSSPGADILEKIIAAIPDINIEWVITGNGDKLKTSIGNISGEVKGIANTGQMSHMQVGNLSFDESRHIDNLINEIAAQRRLTEKRDEQIDRLLSLIETAKK